MVLELIQREDERSENLGSRPDFEHGLVMRIAQSKTVTTKAGYDDKLLASVDRRKS
jgi:hypothetical protein